MADDPTEIVLEHLKVLRLEPGDVLVFRYPGRISTEGFGRLRTRFAEAFGEQHKVIALEDGADLGVVRFMTQQQLDDGIITGGQAVAAALRDATRPSEG